MSKSVTECPDIPGIAIIAKTLLASQWPVPGLQCTAKVLEAIQFTTILVSLEPKIQVSQVLQVSKTNNRGWQKEALNLVQLKVSQLLQLRKHRRKCLKLSFWHMNVLKLLQL